MLIFLLLNLYHVFKRCDRHWERIVFLGLTHAHQYLDKVNSTAILKHSQISEDFNYCDRRQQLEEKGPPNINFRHENPK